MAWYHRLLNGFRAERAARDIDREMAFHLAERADELQASGMPSRDAMLEARRRFGNRAILGAQAREIDIADWVASTLADTRYALRALRANPGFTCVAILSLAFGIGINTAIFSLTDALLLKTLPVSHPEQLLHVYMDSVGNDDVFTYPLWEQIRDQSAGWAGAIAHATTSFDLANGGVERRVDGAWVNGDFFTVLGVRPVAGRLFSRLDDQRGCAPSAVVSEAFADRELGGAAHAVGATLSLNGHPFPIIGVSDGRFLDIEIGRAANVFVPLCAQAIINARGPAILDARSRWYLDLFLRPQPGVSRAQVAARLATIAPRVFAATVPANFSTADQKEYLAQRLGVVPAATGLSDMRATYRLALVTLLSIVVVVLIVACMNLANLLLARAAARRREIAIRLAIGASRARLLRQLLTESLLLAGAGTAAGVVFARWASRLLVGFLSTTNTPVSFDLSPDWRVLTFTIVIAAASVALFGILPALHATRVDAQSAIRVGGRGVTGDTRRRLGSALVVGQVALSLALLSSAGLLLGSFRKLLTVDMGFRHSGVVIAQMDFRSAHYAPDALLRVNRDLLARLRAAPGVASASASWNVPISDAAWDEWVAIDGDAPGKGPHAVAYMNSVSEGYFATLGTALLRGRDITAADIDQGRRVAVVNQTMALRFFKTDDPVGRTFRLQAGDTLTPPWEVVGVVHDATYRTLSEATLPTAYLPLGEGGVGLDVTMFALTGTSDAGALFSIARAASAAVNPAISLRVTTFDQRLSDSLARPRLLALLSTFFGALALLLAVIGLYGTMSYNIARRSNEIGIRMALGAAKGQVLRAVARDAAILIAIGIAVGAGLAVASTRFVRTLLYGLSPTDPSTFAAASLLLGLVAMAAALVPAVRASRVNPVDALREE